MARRYRLFKFYVSRDTPLARLLEGMPSHLRNAFIRDAIERYGKGSASPEGDVVALTDIMGVDAK